MTTSITAVADKQEFSIAAAIEKLPPPAFRLMAMAGVGMPEAKIPVASLDRQLSASKLTTEQRIELKVSLDRAGLLL